MASSDISGNATQAHEQAVQEHPNDHLEYCSLVTNEYFPRDTSPPGWNENIFQVALPAVEMDVSLINTKSKSKRKMVAKSSNVELVDALSSRVTRIDQEDMPKKKCCCSCNIVFLDMLEDLVRDRFITIFVVMFLLTMIVFSGTVSFDNTQHVEDLSFAAPPQYSLTIGIPSGRTPRVQASMSDSYLPRSCADPNSPNCPKIHAKITDVVTSNSEYSLDCSWAHLNDVKDTLEGQRLHEACSTSVTNGIAATDSKGLADFSGFAIHGPEGKYKLHFGVNRAQLAFTVEMVNPVVAMFLIKGFLKYENVYFNVGEPLPVQPKILVRPLAFPNSNKIVVTLVGWTCCEFLVIVAIVIF